MEKSLLTCSNELQLIQLNARWLAYMDLVLHCICVVSCLLHLRLRFLLVRTIVMFDYSG